MLKLKVNNIEIEIEVVEIYGMQYIGDITITGDTTVADEYNIKQIQAALAVWEKQKGS